MDSENSTMPAIKPVDAVFQSSVLRRPAQPHQRKLQKKVPEGYKLVKIPKPDGIFKTILRPIAKMRSLGLLPRRRSPTKMLDLFPSRLMEPLPHQNFPRRLSSNLARSKLFLVNSKLPRRQRRHLSAELQ
jgi:hypothetical protein